MTDPFRHHPGLRDLVKDPMTSGMRNFDAHKLAAANPDLNISEFLIPRDEREAGRKAFLADLPPDDLWVFGYGSLCWDPAFKFAEVRRAEVTGFKRRFILVDSYGGRGTKDAPGLMAALDRSPDYASPCHGIAFRIARDKIEEETPQIWARERAGDAYQATLVDIQLTDRKVTALTFEADHDSIAIHANITRADQIAYLATGTGFLGDSFEYATNLETNLAALGILDDDLSDLIKCARDHQLAPATKLV